MTYSAYETSQASGQPIQLFKFIWGADPMVDYYGYTDYTEQVTLADGTVYEPVPIDRGSIDSNGTLDKSALKVNTDVGTAIAEIFRVYPPPQVVSLIIRQGHFGDVDEEFLVIWAGRIVSAHREHDELVMTGEPISTSLRRPGLRRHYQIGCPHALYSQGPGLCNADKAAATLTGRIVSAITGATVTLASGWEGAFDPDKFLGGLMEWTTASGNTDRRTIIRRSGDVLSLNGLPQGLAVSDTVSVVLGCNHQAFAPSGDCQGLHVPADASNPTNIRNYGGDLWIPIKNPIGTFNNYY